MSRIITVVTALVFTVAGLTACGGGSVSSGAGGARSSDNLVVKVNSNGSAFFQSGPEQGNRMLAAVADFLIDDARAAALEGHTVTVYDSTNVAVGQDVTDVNGEATFLLPPGNYTVCIDEATPTTGTGCVTVTIADNSLVTATVTCDGDPLSPTCSLSEITEEDVTSIQDPDKPHKVIICHIPPGNPDNKRTLSVDQESLQDHLDHGDTAGPCPEPEPDTDTVDASSDNEGNGNNGNNGNGNGNNGNNGNRPNQD